jgi:hypothetical protein
MGVATELAAIKFTPDHLQRAVNNGHDIGAVMRSARLKIGEVIRDLRTAYNFAEPNDPNRKVLEDQIEALS